MSTQTGYMAAIGAPQIPGVRALVGAINAQGGVNGHKLELVTYDDASSETEAVLIAKKLIQEDKVLAMFGVVYVGAMMAVTPVAEAAEVPLITHGGSVAADRPLKKWMFRISSGEPDMIGPLFEYLKKKGANKIAILYQGAGYGQAGWRFMQSMAPKFGLEIVVGEAYNPRATDFAPQLTKIRSAGAEGILVYGAEMAGALAIKQAIEMGIDVPIVTPPGMSNPDIVKAVRQAFEAPNFAMLNMSQAVWQQLPDTDPVKKPAGEVDALIRKTFNRPANQWEALGYSSVAILVDALKRANLSGDPDKLKEERAKLRDALETVKIAVPVGVYEFSPTNHAGYILGSGAQMTVLREGRWNLAK
jgi:branched-chain amino acid transport system substrate-binding protein